ncbi:MAG: anti-sigma factor antagonist [Chloroflexus sp.]|uniref:STAS domain-containing protein n=1 Tax=Chloroflexus sp. TaxID=1904827 RepID=UPI0021DEFC98|nr:STAS domain-containing protein [Chloroflexus sp.]GIV91002.1 MAG: anti-sigma factor antagonist [Chloroflexus sp.]
MRTFSRDRWLVVSNPDPELQRRGRNILLVGLILIFLVIASLPLVAIQPDPWPQVLTSVIGVLFIIGVMLLARRGWVDWSTIGMVAVLAVSFALIPFVTGQIGLTPVYATVAVVVAAVIGQERHILFAMLICIAGMIGQGFGLIGQNQVSPSPGEVVAVGVILTVVCGVIAGIGTRSVRHAIELANAAQLRAEALAKQLAQANEALEARVVERTAALQAALAESEQRQAALTAALAENERQRQEIQALSVPILAVREGMLVMPLIGALDGVRLALAQQRALQAVHDSRARWLLVDVTGVPFLDQTAADGVITLARSVRLLGARLVLIGVGPEVAQTMVGLKMELRAIDVVRDLRDALLRFSS